ncbi:unnamed protein product, partial [Rotaria magnacalcarata]
KNPTQPKLPQNPSTLSSSSSSSGTNVRTIINLIDSLVDEKQFDNSDENILSTIDCLISSLKHMREKIKTINHDDTHPLNLSKPKVQQHTHDDANATATPSNFPLASALFSSQPFLSPFSVANMTHFQNYLKLSAASVLNDSINLKNGENNNLKGSLPSPFLAGFNMFPFTTASGHLPHHPSNAKTTSIDTKNANHNNNNHHPHRRDSSIDKSLSL